MLLRATDAEAQYGKEGSALRSARSSPVARVPLPSSPAFRPASVRTRTVMPNLTGVRLAVLMTWPQPFHLPIFRVLRDDYGLQVDYYCLRQERSRGWGKLNRLYPITSMAGALRLGRAEVTLPPIRLLAAVARGKYDCVVIGGWERSHHVALHMLCARCGVPVLVGSDLRAGAGGRANRPRPVLRDWIRGKVLRRILSQATVALATGKAAADWFLAFGSPRVVRTGFFGVDTDLFCPPANRPPDDRLRLLCVGRLVERKRVSDAVKAVGRLVARGVPVELTSAGQGPCRETMDQLVSESGLRDHIRMLGSVPHGAVAGLMRRSNVFVFPSAEEPWGLTLIEAAATGNILVASDQVGAVHDVLVPGRNGYVHATGDVDDLTQCLLRVWRDLQAGRGPEMRAISRGRACRFSFRQCAREYAEAIGYAMGDGARQPPREPELG